MPKVTQFRSSRAEVATLSFCKQGLLSSLPGQLCLGKGRAADSPGVPWELAESSETRLGNNN